MDPKILHPLMTGYYHKELDFKFFGGSIHFLQEKTNIIARYIDTRNIDISIWVSNMRAVTAPSIIYFYVDIYDPGAATSFTVPFYRVTTSAAVNGYTLPKRIFDIGIQRIVFDIGIVVVNPSNPDNHEFFFWNGGTPANQYIIASIL